MTLLVLHKHAKVGVEDPAEEKHEELLHNTTIILTLLISKYDLWGWGRRERERERERNLIICMCTLLIEILILWYRVITIP